ncbi:Arylsulfatase [Luteitalea pratensis]|uniref:Arylsulfatase n=1 Tax=Luteitalea pratensis TaxID=1855912 RepID=A0A143PI08_LUTPR|nr:sulfatase [Luteitalea pratensis]AMY07409.1 Arylsulfatase [Luteitalea pratensis]
MNGPPVGQVGTALRAVHCLATLSRITRWYIALGLLAGLAATAMLRAHAGGAQATAASTLPNIVVVLADDLGYGDLASYGHPLHRTPHLDAMAREGMRATSAYAPSPSCSPTRASLLTGRYAFRVGIRAPLSPRSSEGLRARDHVTLPQVLHSAGYRTMLVGKWHLGDQPGMRPMDHGFDRFVGLLYSHDYKAPFVETPEKLALWNGEQRRVEEPDPATLTATYTQEAVSFIKESASARRPFFLYLAHSMPHVPLAVSPKWRGTTSSPYGDVMAELDDSIGQVRAALAAAGVAGNTLVIFTSDNGPWNAMPDRMFGRDIVKPWDHGTTGPFRGGKAGTYEGGHRVPLIAVWPGTIRPGQVTEAPISIVDFFPTLAGRAHLADKVPANVDGLDVWPALSGATANPPERMLLYDNLGKAEAIRVGPWKLRESTTGQGEARQEKVELFDLLRDPSERYDQAGVQPEEVARLRARLDAENARR